MENNEINGKFIPLKEFTKLSGVSRSNVLRFYAKNSEIKSDTFLIKNKRFYPIYHVKFFNSQIMFDENRRLLIENKNLKEIISKL